MKVGNIEVTVGQKWVASGGDLVEIDVVHPAPEGSIRADIVGGYIRAAHRLVIMEAPEDFAYLADGNGVILSAAAVAPSKIRYRVVDVHDHQRLRVGDTVVMLETRDYENVLLRVSDYTLHSLQDPDGQYVHLEAV